MLLFHREAAGQQGQRAACPVMGTGVRSSEMQERPRSCTVARELTKARLGPAQRAPCCGKAGM